jgi:catechol 2,3-dioxygenase-like lactoylglutathione lyase family enzyme
MPDLFKTGLIVSDLEQAMKDLSVWLGVSWTPVQEAPLTLRTADGDQHTNLRFVFSTSGPLYFELLQAQSSGYYAASEGEQLHHVGRWVDDLAEASRELEAAGFPLEAVGVDAEGNCPAVFCFHKGAHGVRVELVPRANRETFEAWLAGGALEI